MKLHKQDFTILGRLVFSDSPLNRDALPVNLELGSEDRERFVEMLRKVEEPGKFAALFHINGEWAAWWPGEDVVSARHDPNLVIEHDG